MRSSLIQFDSLTMVRVLCGAVFFLLAAVGLAQEPSSPAGLRALLIDDMRLPHELPPSGVPENWNWARSGRVGLGNKPGSFHAFIAWGQIYKARGSNIAPGTQVEIGKVVACVLPKGDSARWKKLSQSAGVRGRAYVEDYKDDRSVDVPQWQLPNGGGTRMQFLDGYNLHFVSTAGRVDIDPNDIQGLYVSMQARWVQNSPGSSPPPLMFSAGADYWLNKTAGWDHLRTNGDAAIGRFRSLGAEWQTYTASTVGAEVLKKYPPDCLYDEPVNGH